MTKACWRTKQKYLQGTDGAFAVPSGLSSTTAARFSGTDGEIANSTTGAQAATVNISSSTNASPIVITSSGSHGLVDGQIVDITSHTTNTNANGRWVIKWISATQFSLNTSTGNGVGGATGTITPWIEVKRSYLSTPSITGTAHGNWTSADLGRLVKLTNSPNPSASPQGTGTTAGTKKYDNWVFRIIAIISTTQVQLEGARFEDPSSAGAGAVNWTLMACSQFSSASASFSSSPTAGTGGSHIDRHITTPPQSGISSANSNLKLQYIPWRIGLVIDGTDVLVNDWTGNVDSFPTGSSLTWYMHDRQAYNYEDLYMIMHRFMCGGAGIGWAVLGANATGTIVAGATPVSGDWITIWDGSQRFTFEWNNGAPGSNHTAVAITSSNAPANATALAAAINGKGWLTATANSSTVTVTCNLYDARGNTNMFCNSGVSGASFGTITGMNGGMNYGQFRGRNNGVQTASGAVNDGYMQDMIYFSNGESDPTNPRRQWLRFLKYNTNSSGNGGTTAGGMGFDFAMWQGWNPVYSNSTTHNPGNGFNPLKSPLFQNTRGADSATVSLSSATNTGWTSSESSTITSAFWEVAAGGNWSAQSSHYPELKANPLGIFGGPQLAIDYVLMGDKDEVHFYVQLGTRGASYMGCGAIQEINQNAQRFMVRAVANSGSNVAIDVGANLDPQGITATRDATVVSPPLITTIYQTNDELQAAGLTTASSAPTGGAFIESDQISNFGTVPASSTNPDGLDYSITVTTLNKTLQIGDIVGEEAMPMFLFAGPNMATQPNAGNCRMHNAAQHGDATFFDWNGDGTAATNDGFNVTEGLGTLGANDLTVVMPNDRGGRWGAVPVVFRNVTEGEFRGKMRYLMYAPDKLSTWSWIPDRANNWYFLVPFCQRQSSTQSSQTLLPVMCFGPVSQTLAKPF